MANKATGQERLSIDVERDEHQRIKICAARKGMSIRVYVLDCVRERLSQEEEALALSSMVGYASPALREVWENEKDAAYDNL